MRSEFISTSTSISTHKPKPLRRMIGTAQALPHGVHVQHECAMDNVL
jgi:hypothetical protein